MKNHIFNCIGASLALGGSLYGQSASSTAIAPDSSNTVVASSMPAGIVISGGTEVTAPTGSASINASRALRANQSAAQGTILRAAINSKITAAANTAAGLGSPAGGSAWGQWQRPLDVVDGVVQYQSSRSLASVSSAKVDQLWPGGSLGLNLTGGTISSAPSVNRRIGLWDGGQALGSHQEFQLGGVSRIVASDSSTVDEHATAVAGSLVAAGVDTLAKGPAYEAVLQVKRSDNSVSDLMSLPFNSLRATNHSYGFDAGWSLVYDPNLFGYEFYWFGDVAVSAAESSLFGAYSQRSRDLDRSVYNLPLQLPVWATANSRNKFYESYSFNYLEYPLHSNNFYPYVVTTYYGYSALLAQEAYPGAANPDLLIVAVPTSPGATTFNWTAIVANLPPLPINGGSDGFDTVTDMEASKNVLSVGGIDANNSLVDVGEATAHGPTDDGRIKPDLVAQSRNAYTTSGASASSYTSYDGTSFAAPVATGAAHLISQLRESSWPQSPLLASTVKAVLIHSADDFIAPVSIDPNTDAGVGPDYRTGWGILNAEAAAKLVRDDMAPTAFHGGIPQRPFIKEVPLANGQQCVWDVKAKGGEQLKVTIAWTDPAGVAQSMNVLDPNAARLVNDLDLTVERLPSGAVYKPWRLDPANPSTPASNTYSDANGNFRDNVEQVVTTGATPTTGELFRVRINQKAGTSLWKSDSAGNLTVGDQMVSIILSGVADNQQQPLQIASHQFITVPASGSTPSSVRWDLTLISVVGQKYIIEATANLVTWTKVSNEVVANSSSLSMSSNVISPAPPSYFFRVRAVSNFPNGIIP